MTGAGPARGPRRLDPGYSITRVRPGVLALAGEFDACNAHALQSALEDLIASGAGCVLDCGAVTYLDSSALHVLARAARLVGDSTIIIESPGPFLTRLLEITGLGRAAHIEIRGAPETRTSEPHSGIPDASDCPPFGEAISDPQSQAVRHPEWRRAIALENEDSDELGAPPNRYEIGSAAGQAVERSRKRVPFSSP